ncbi:hypothetical protein like AT3G14470 [Hibiscus trionum]|uniref:Disease resistance RPP13-like protein 1 n=1 Tax=Hibiscus trionum TaxID=183268 RepID=A0A9W7J520_HIBTR|nr:hypothetical protein like AT3G14470 [Hibiscus trionum]
MAFIGEAALSKLFDLLLDKSIDVALNFVADHKQVYDQLMEWKSILPDIKAVLNHAEEKQIKDEGVKSWLEDLQDLAYDADDILDEFAYQELRLKLQNTEAQARPTKIRKLLSSWFTGSSSSQSSFLFNNSMIPKIQDITARLNSLATRRSSLGLSEILPQAASSDGKKSVRLQPTSVMDGAVEYVGRDDEKREMLDLLKTNNSDGVCVLSIVGMGGMGKTTLAQLVYNNPSIEKSFDHRAWVCVSDDFDAVKISNSILKYIDPSSSDLNDLSLLQVKLKEKLSGKRFLLVLYDIWNESYDDWTILGSPFGAMSKIIVTTRLQNVSSNVDPLKAFHLDKLSQEDCLSIFTQHALRARNFEEHLQFKQVGESIVRRCNGLPLAAKAMGSLLRTTKNLDDWERINESEIWDLPENQCGIIPALRLSYNYLPSHLKHCFAYCAIFPKDYEFEEEKLILLWSAEGFLQQKAKNQIRDLRSQYFQDLVSRSFFQISGKNKSRFVMHDLINDLAQLVAGDICCRLEDDKQQMFSHRSRHSSYIASCYDTVKKFGAFDQANSLRTFLQLKKYQWWQSCYLTNVVLVELLPRLGYLRALSLCGYWITELPDFLENLKHLRYLNLSHTQIKCLPDSLCTLYYLETLLLKGCSKLQRLPSEMENLVNLHYLDIRGADSIEKRPLGIGNLINLRRLSDFVIGEGDGHQIGELKSLSNVRGDFCLSGLENVNGQEAKEARLNEKSGINTLILQWSGDLEKPTRKKEVEEQVLDSLHPPKKLEQLVIENFCGAKFCTWIVDSSFKKLSSLKLLGCKNCKSVPLIGRLPLLKGLSIGGMDEVHKIGIEFFGEDQSIAFASLETLSFESLPNWEQWDACEGDEQVSKFPSLCKLSIRQCPHLLGRLPTRLQSLQRLEIKECSRLVVSISSFPSLRELRVDGCEELVDECSSSPVEVASLQSVSLSSISKFSIAAERRLLRFANSKDFEMKDFNKLPEVLHAFTFLTRMVVESFPGLVCFAESNFPPALKELRIYKCDELQYLFDESMSSKTCLLEHLEIESCSSLIRLSSRGDIYNRLQHLEIDSCPKLRSLFLNSKLPVMLKKLDIRFCPALECIAQDFHETSDLEVIRIWAAVKMKCLPRGLDMLSQLQQINLEGCSNLVVCFDEIGMPTTNLRFFEISGCENIRSLPKCINNFTSLQRLVVYNCGANISFPEEGFPTNLTSLRIWKAPRIYSSLVEWGFHRLNSLQDLYINAEGCLNVVSFPEERIEMTLPPSLTSIWISDFKNLEFMCSKGFQHLTSLQCLTISSCPKLTSLPEKDMLLSLGRLSIYSCPLLEEECRRVKGREWSKISHIPHVQIDGKDFIPRGGD